MDVSMMTSSTKPRANSLVTDALFTRLNNNGYDVTADTTEAVSAFYHEVSNEQVEHNNNNHKKNMEKKKQEKKITLEKKQKKKLGRPSNTLKSQQQQQQHRRSLSPHRGKKNSGGDLRRSHSDPEISSIFTTLLSPGMFFFHNFFLFHFF